MRTDTSLVGLPVREVIGGIGQEYVDEPIHQTGPVYCGKEPMEGRWLRYYKRTPLRWMKPDGKGGLRPMNNTHQRNGRERGTRCP